MRITKKFLQLTKKTYPHGTEKQLQTHLPKGYKIDEWGNYYLEIGESTTMFTCHLDTASYSESRVNHIFEGNYIKTDGSSILGADDKAGMVVLLYMIEKQVPGLYYFFLGEERGCIGSSDVSKYWETLPFSDKIKKVISFDRRGTSSIITEQFGGVCCSDEFAEELCLRLNSVDKDFQFRPDPTGIYTDSAQFTDIVPECTNISVGYYNEHSHSERQDIEFLKKLCKASTKIDWESLPIVRDYKVSKHYPMNPVDDDWITDSTYSEDDLIKNFLSFMNIEHDDFLWDGESLYITNGNTDEFIGTRQELSQFISDFDDLPY